MCANPLIASAARSCSSTIVVVEHWCVALQMKLNHILHYLDCIGCLNSYGNYYAQVSDANPCSFVLTFRLHIVSNRCLLTSLSNLYAATICLDYECT